MAKIKRQKARKEYQCCKCGKTIQIGENYKKIIEMYRKTRTVCDKCNVPRSELTTSEYLSWLYDFQDNFVLNTQEDIQVIIDTIQEQKEYLEEKLENIPEQLRDADAGTTIQERIEILEDAICQLEQIDFDECSECDEEDMQEELENKIEEARDIIMSL